jgi:hypothetical protein
MIILILFTYNQDLLNGITNSDSVASPIIDAASLNTNNDVQNDAIANKVVESNGK